MTDALSLLHQRANPTTGPNAGEGVVPSGGYIAGPAKGVLRDGDLNDLMVLPGTPAYARRQEILRQQAIARGEVQDIEVIGAAGLVLPEQPLLASDPVAPETPVAPAQPPATKRVAIYYGKGDTYNVAVESAPDWDTETMFRQMDEGQVNVIVHLSNALGVKISDKTGDFS